MKMSNSMTNRVRRVKASARRKLIAQLEVDAKKKVPEGAKSKSTDKDDGTGKKPAAGKKYDRKKVQPKPKGKKDEAKLDKPTGDAEPVGYPMKTKGGLGKGKGKSQSKTNKQKALSDADKKRKELSSDTPKLKATPKPKLKTSPKPKAKASPKSKVKSATTHREWRKETLAQLKQALLDGQASDEEMDTEQVAPGDMKDMTGKASDAQRGPAGKVLQKAQQMVPMMTQQLSQANDMLEEAILGNNLQKIKGALAFLLTKIQEITKGQIVPLGATIRKLMAGLSPQQAKSAKYASVRRTASYLKKLDDEFSRSKHLMRMSASRVTL